MDPKERAGKQTETEKAVMREKADMKQEESDGKRNIVRPGLAGFVGFV